MEPRCVSSGSCNMSCRAGGMPPPTTYRLLTRQDRDELSHFFDVPSWSVIQLVRRGHAARPTGRYFRHILSKNTSIPDDMLYSIPMKGGSTVTRHRCRDCTYYIRHYVFIREHYLAAWCGHCIHKRIKQRKPDHKSCRYYQKREP